jgi:succinyl-CoA synthetase alpha subunit
MQSAARSNLRSASRLRVGQNRDHHGQATSCRHFGSTSCRQNYAATLKNLCIGSKTRVIFQGFTGRQATANAQESVAWGTNVVGGVTPGKEGEHLGLPVLPSVRRAVEELKPDATGIYVPASKAAPAIEEAIEAEVPLIVAVAEHVPLHDMLRIHSMLKTQSKSRLVGPNSPGIISSAKGERCRIGFQPLPCFSTGCVGIAAKSGTLSYEAVASTTRAGLGQSLCIGVGGDILPGTDLVEALQALEHDPATRAIALIGEIGGDGEVLAAQWITDYHARTPVAQRKPIVALIAGQRAPRDRVMGHAGAFWLPGEPEPEHKVEALRRAGVTVVNHPAKIGAALVKLLDGNGNASQPLAGEIGAEFASTDDFATAASGILPSQQRRGLHTSSRRPASTSLPSRSRPRASPHQTRNLHLDSTASEQLLKESRLGSDLRYNTFPVRYLALGIDRATRSQCLITAVHFDVKSLRKPSSYDKILLPPGATDILALDGTEAWDEAVTTLISKLKIGDLPGSGAATSVGNLLRDLARVFSDNEAKHVGLQFNVREQKRKLQFPVYDLRIELDDSASRSGGRLADVHYKYAALEARDPGAREAEAEGIVYHRLSPGNKAHNIGTLVNGAGLAMNTIDALADHGGLAANFLDTGGKATSETVRRSFQIILRDDRVKVVFVNIFGGLTLGDMIARGIVLAYNEVDIKVPVVVRIRGTNEEEAQRIIAASGLPLYAFDDFDEAAEKAIELAAGAAVAKEATALVDESAGAAAEKAGGIAKDAPPHRDMVEDQVGKSPDPAKSGALIQSIQAAGSEHVA